MEDEVRPRTLREMVPGHYVAWHNEAIMKWRYDGPFPTQELAEQHLEQSGYPSPPALVVQKIKFD